MCEYFSRMDPSHWNCWIKDYAYFNSRRSARLPSKNVAPIHTPAKTVWGCFPEHCCQHWGLWVTLIFSHQMGRHWISVLFSVHVSDYHWCWGSFRMFNGYLDFFCELSVDIFCPFFHLDVAFLLMYQLFPATKLLCSHVHSALQFFHWIFSCNLNGHPFHFQLLYCFFFFLFITAHSCFMDDLSSYSTEKIHSHLLKAISVLETGYFLGSQFCCWAWHLSFVVMIFLKYLQILS